MAGDLQGAGLQRGDHARQAQAAQGALEFNTGHGHRLPPPGLVREWSSQNDWYSAMARIAGASWVRSSGGRRADGRLPFERTPDGGVRDASGADEAAADRLDLGAGVGARQVGQPVERPLPGPAETGEERSGQLLRLRADPGGLLEQAGGLARGVEDPIPLLEHELALALALARGGAAAARTGRRSRSPPGRRGSGPRLRSRRRQRRVVGAVDLHQPRVVHRARAGLEVAEAFQRQRPQSAAAPRGTAPGPGASCGRGCAAPPSAPPSAPAMRSAPRSTRTCAP